MKFSIKRMVQGFYQLRRIFLATVQNRPNVAVTAPVRYRSSQPVEAANLFVHVAI